MWITPKNLYFIAKTNENKSVESMKINCLFFVDNYFVY